MNKVKKLFLISALLFGSVALGQSAEELFNEGITADRAGNFAKSAKLYEQACNNSLGEACQIVKTHF